MTEKLRIGIVQLNSNVNKAQNIATAVKLIRKAADDGAKLVVLPELFNCLGPFASVLDSAESTDGPTAQTMSQTASQLGIYLCSGSICEQSTKSGFGHNTSLFFGPDGALLSKYRKIHLFDIQLAGEVEISESSAMVAGNEIVTAKMGDLTVGFATCYDLRFPEIFRQLSERKVEIVCFPSAFTKVTGRAHWHTLVRARAIENQFFMVAANQVGKHSKNLESFGHSMVVDPWGKILTELADEPSVAVIEIDMRELVKTRASLPALAHRKIFFDKEGHNKTN